MEGWVEEHVMRFIGEGSNIQDFIDIMFLVIEGTTMFAHSRETIIKAIVMVYYASFFLGKVCFL